MNLVRGNIENVLVITDHFTRYAQAFPSKTQTALATAKLLWNNFILHYGFPEKIITDQGRNFESELIEHLCQLAGVQKLRISPYHPQTNGQCERFNGTLLNMLGNINPRAEEGLEKSCPLLWYMPTTAPGMQPLGSAHTFFLFGREPRLSVGCRVWTSNGRPKGFPWGVQLHLTTEKKI